ncbi:MAG: phage-related regulatory protein [Candidatus Tectimicrobiota bacterium]|nr:MAG: phage-related regulatory protein [Candidatus Tectomicrobia bacterium]
MRTVAFFNHKGGVGKTSLVYHLAWMYADLGFSVIAADLDPQANLTGMFLDEDRLEALWEAPTRATVFGALSPILEGIGDIAEPHIEDVAPGLGLVVGDLWLSLAEDELSSQWPDCLDRKPRAFRVLSALWRILRQAALAREAQLVLIDIGPNLGALNRAAMVAADYVVVPLAADLFSLQGLRNLGPTLRRWREEWRERRERKPQELDLALPHGTMEPVGYVVMQHAIRLDRPVKAYNRWMDRIPNEYARSVLGQDQETSLTIDTDPSCLATLKHYRSLMPLAQEARKPMFALKPADGAIGGHAQAVQGCYRDFRALALKIGQRIGLEGPCHSRPP